MKRIKYIESADLLRLGTGRLYGSDLLSFALQATCSTLRCGGQGGVHEWLCII